MDIQVRGAEPTSEERQAVDDLLGAAPSGWEGGARDIARDGRAGRGGRAARAQRELLLPALHAVQDRVGWVSEGALNYICQRLTVPPADAWGVVTFYHLFATAPRRRGGHVCDDLACRLRGAEELCARLTESSDRLGEPPRDGGGTWVRSPCLGPLRAGAGGARGARGSAPATETSRPGTVGPTALARPRRRHHRARHLTAARFADLRAVGAAGREPGTQAAVGAWASVDPCEPRRLSRGLAAMRALTARSGSDPRGSSPSSPASKLVGRGGAAFPAGRKWEAVARAAEKTRYVVCNADESEPGTFKDRVLLEEDPFAIVEAMTIAGFACGAEEGFVYLRGEYPQAEARLRQALAAARAAGLLGEDCRGAGFPSTSRSGAAPGPTSAAKRRRCSIRSRASAASRARSRRSRSRSACSASRRWSTTSRRSPTCRGSCSKAARASAPRAPTNRPARSSSASPARSSARASTRLPFGTTLGELLTLAGGVSGGRDLLAVLLGGAAGSFVGAGVGSTCAHLRRHPRGRATLGSGVVLVYGAGADLGDDARADRRVLPPRKSCGQCVPCRVGTVRQLELLAAAAPRAPLGVTGRRRWHSSPSSGRRCATPRSAASARPPPPPSPRRSHSSILFRPEERGAARRIMTSDPIWFTPPPRSPRIPRRHRRRSAPRGARDRRPGRSSVRPARRCSTPAAPPGSTCRRCATSRRSRRRTPAVCVSSKSKGRAFWRRPVRASAEAGMKVRTPVRARALSRKLVLELLGLVGRPFDRARPRRAHAEYGARPGALRRRRATGRVGPVKIDNDLYVRDYGKCVLCYKCVDACGHDAQNTFAIAAAGRGASTPTSRPSATFPCRPRPASTAATASPSARPAR
jgi:NADH-quinone oxidoreductase subunit F